MTTDALRISLAALTPSRAHRSSSMSNFPDQLKNRIPIISLFSGCGGLDLGFAQAGFRTVVALDINPVAVKTFNQNYNTVAKGHIDTELAGSPSIAKVSDLSRENGNEVLQRIEAMHFEFPVRGVIGGSPCQTFSHSNVRSNGDDIRHSLPGTYAAILKVLNEALSLDFFVFENVRGITFQKHSKEFALFKGQFEDAGFRLFEGLLDARNYNVAQKRPRVFVVGWNKDRYNYWDYLFPRPSDNASPSVRDAIGELPEPVYFQRGLTPADIPHHPNHWTMRPKSRKFEDGNLMPGQNKGRSFRVLSWDEPSWAVAYGNREIHIHPSGKRRLSVYEAMLLQGFPRQGYQLLGTLSDQIRQVSDAVPPPLARALAESVMAFLESGGRSGTPRLQQPFSYE